MVGHFQSLLADPLGGSAAETVAKNVLQGTARIVAVIFEIGEVKGFAQVGEDVINQFVEGVSAMFLAQPQPDVGRFLP